MTTILRARVAHTPRDPFHADGALETFDDGAVAFDGGRIVATGPFSRVNAEFTGAEVLDRRDCILLPGFVDTHGVRFGMGTDVGAGTGLSMLKEGLVAYHVQMVRDQGHMLRPARLLWLATARARSG
jgi:guanine deaminase